MRVDTVVEILKALPGVRVTTVTIGRSMNDYSELRVELSVDERPEPDKLVITVKPGDPPPEPNPSITLTGCAGCGAPGHYVRSKYCDACRIEQSRVPF